MKSFHPLGMSHGGKNTKIHGLVDGLGNPIRFIFTGGGVHGSKEGIPLLEGVAFATSAVLGNKAYGTTQFLATIRENGGTVVLPPKSNAAEPWECDYHHDKKRHGVEFFFNKRKHSRRAATRYDKLSSMFQAFAFRACVMIWHYDGIFEWSDRP